MSDLKAVINTEGEIVGAIGRFAKDLHDDSDISQMTVSLGDIDIPAGFVRDHYTVVEKDEKYSLKKKSATEIATIKQAKAEAKRPKFMEDIKALDVSGESEAVKLLFDFIKAQHG